MKRQFNVLPTVFVTLSLGIAFAATPAYAGPISSGIKAPGKSANPSQPGPPPGQDKEQDKDKATPPGQDQNKDKGGGRGGGGGSTCGSGCLDLTTKGAAGTLGGATFKQIDPQPTGTGKIKPFLRLQAHGSETTEEGYGTSYRDFEFDEKNPIRFTHDLLLSDVGVFTIDGVKYREFLLDVNEDTGHDDEFLSLDKLMIWESPTGMQHDFPSLGSLVYDLDGGGLDRWVKMDYSLAHGSGSGDMAVYIRDDLFHGLDYVYLYSRFGDHDAASAGFEEWWTRKGEKQTVPEPSLMLMLGTGVAGILARRRLRKS